MIYQYEVLTNLSMKPKENYICIRKKGLELNIKIFRV